MVYHISKSFCFEFDFANSSTSSFIKSFKLNNHILLVGKYHYFIRNLYLYGTCVSIVIIPALRAQFIDGNPGESPNAVSFESAQFASTDFTPAMGYN